MTPERKGAPGRNTGDPLSTLLTGNVGEDTQNRPDLQSSDRAGQFAAAARRQRLARHLHALGPRAMLEALQEVGAGADLDIVLSRYARLPREVVRRLGGDRWPPTLWLVNSG